MTTHGTKVKSKSPCILLQTVGTGRAETNPVWEAMAYSIKTIQPDILIHLCSEKTKQTVDRVKDELKKAGHPWPDQHDIRTPEKNKNDTLQVEDNVERLTLEYDKLIDKYKTDHPDAQLHADFTSGTKAMSAALVAAALAKGAVKLHYAIGPRDEGGRATKTDRLVSLQSDQLIGRHRLDEAGSLFDRGQFEAALAIAHDIEPSLSDDVLLARCKSLQYMAEVCDNWQRFDWKGAYSKLRDYIEDQKPYIVQLRRAGWDTDHLQKLKPYLHKARNNDNNIKATDEKLVDLLANADRCIDYGRYDDAVARLYRLCEYIGQTRLFDHGIKNTSNAPTALLKEIAPNWYNNKTICHRQETVKLGVRDNIDILHECGDTVGHFMHELYVGNTTDNQCKGPLHQLLNKRNDSLLAHGSTPIKPKDAKALFDMIQKILAQHIGDEKLENLLAIARFPACPWAPERPMPLLTFGS